MEKIRKNSLSKILLVSAFVPKRPHGLWFDLFVPNQGNSGKIRYVTEN